MWVMFKDKLGDVAVVDCFVTCCVFCLLGDGKSMEGLPGKNSEEVLKFKHVKG